MGLVLMRALVDEAHYAREGPANVLHLVAQVGAIGGLDMALSIRTEEKHVFATTLHLAGRSSTRRPPRSWNRSWTRPWRGRSRRWCST
jgi:hypothetical protein